MQILAATDVGRLLFAPPDPAWESVPSGTHKRDGPRQRLLLLLLLA